MNLGANLYVHVPDVIVVLNNRLLPDTTIPTDIGELEPRDRLRSAVEISVYSVFAVVKSHVPITVPILETLVELWK